MAVPWRVGTEAWTAANINQDRSNRNVSSYDFPCRIAIGLKPLVVKMVLEREVAKCRRPLGIFVQPLSDRFSVCVLMRPVAVVLGLEKVALLEILEDLDDH
jgi:hypothetical protein